MDGRNSSGRRVNLLCDSPVDKYTPTSSARPSFPRFTSSFGQSLPLHTRAYSFARSNSPSSSPPTPQLVRSDSEYSSAMNRTPSPVTPNFIDFNGLQPTSKQDYPPTASTFFPADPSSMAQYPPIPQHAAQFTYPAPPAIAPQPQLNQGPQGPPSISDQASTSSKGPAKQQTKKNSYPCPLAKQFNCQDHFTTSGHAARHAKKHTGKKDAFCPECNKAFTRKDNMEQHRRTHQNGRNATKSNGESAAKRQRTSKRASTAGTSSSVADAAVASSLPLQTSMPAPSMLDPSLAHSPASSFGFPEAAFASALDPTMQHYANPMMQFSGFPPQSPTMVLDPALGGQMPNGMANGLDTLAMAAAKRDEHF